MRSVQDSPKQADQWPPSTNEGITVVVICSRPVRQGAAGWNRDARNPARYARPGGHYLALRVTTGFGASASFFAASLSPESAGLSSASLSFSSCCELTVPRFLAGI